MLQFHPLPISPAQCAAVDNHFTCNFGLYGGSQPLQQSQKLAPNDGLVGWLMAQGFMGSAFTALILSLILLVDKVLYHRARSDATGHKQHRRAIDSISHSKHYMHAMHLIETALHTLSDQQLALSTALLIALDTQACKVSAYHYDIACALLVLSFVVHLNTLANTHDFILKGKSVAFFRIASIIAQMVVSAIVLSARINQSFPTSASRLAIMPAACFESANASSDLGFGTFINLAENATSNGTTNGAANATQIVDNVRATVSDANGAGQYVVLVISVLFALVLLFVDMCETWQAPDGVHYRYASIIGGFLVFSLTLGVTAATVYQYHGLRSGMEVPDLYQTATDAGATSVSQIIPLSMLGSLILPVFKAVGESLDGQRSRRFKQGLKDLDLAEKFGETAYRRGQNVEHGYEMVNRDGPHA